MIPRMAYAGPTRMQDQDRWHPPGVPDQHQRCIYGDDEKLYMAEKYLMKAIDEFLMTKLIRNLLFRRTVVYCREEQ